MSGARLHGSPSTSSRQTSALILREAQSSCKPFDRFGVGLAPRTAFQIGHGTHTQLRPFGEHVLGQPSRQSMLSQECAEERCLRRPILEFDLVRRFHESLRERSNVRPPAAHAASCQRGPDCARFPTSEVSRP
jgi:hypothetical protein